jgi:TctA family transporter
MLDIALEAIAQMLVPERLAMLLLGVAAGMFFGVMPGLGGIAAASILLPFILQLDPLAAVATLLGSIAVIYTADTITSVLTGTPGSPASAPTAVEGYALARQGRAAEALSLGFLASISGSLLGAVVLFLAIPIAGPLVLMLGTAELFMLALLGLVMASSLITGRFLVGLLCGGLGLLLGAVGPAPAAVEFRFTFGQVYLWDGLPLTLVALGLFGIPEIVSLLAKGGSISASAEMGRGWGHGVAIWWRERWLVLRCALIGAIGGFVPAVGASASTWVAYAHAAASGRKPQGGRDELRFGKGEPRGIAAAESANNTTAVSDLVPTVLFGVPGGPTAAIFLGGLLALGFVPGPRLVSDEPVLLYSMVWSVAIASVVGGALCFLLAPMIARLTRVRFVWIGVPLLLVISLGALRTSGTVGDLLVLVAIGLVGWAMRQANWPRAPVLVGFVLAGPMEQYFWLAVQLHGWTWLLRPGVIAIALLLLVPVVLSITRKKRAASLSQDKAPSTPRPAMDDENARPLGSFLLAASILCLLVYCLIDAFGMRANARLLPLLGIGLALPGAIWVTSTGILARRRSGLAQTGGTDALHLDVRELSLWGALVLFVPLTALVGFFPSVFVLLLLVTTFWSGLRLTRALPFLVAVMGAGILMADFLYLSPPTGFLDPVIARIFQP